ncbi:MAG: electron transport complex subunit RsxE [Planctomycetota bacterium]|jgi:electron transport complex protein RnfE
MGRLGELTKGLMRENPVLVLLLGLCPTLAITTGVGNAIGMGLSATFVLVGSNVIISLFSRFFPRSIRIPCFIVVIATFVTIVKMVLAGYFPALDESLGIFIPLIVVNCIILGRAEAFASKHGVAGSLLDGIGMGAGFTVALLIISSIREVLGSWKLFGTPITDGGFDPVKVLVMAPGAFLVLGLVLAVRAARGGSLAEADRRRLAAEERDAWEAARPVPASAKKKPAEGGA